MFTHIYTKVNREEFQINERNFLSEQFPFSHNVQFSPDGWVTYILQ